MTCNLLRNTPELLTVQTQPDCIALDQRGVHNRVLLSGRDAAAHLWRGYADGRDYLACFRLDRGEDAVEFPVPEDLRGLHAVDVWTGEPFASLGEVLRVPMTAHSVRLLRFPPRG